MNTPLLSITLNTKRDLLRARQMARHLADLLGFDAFDQLSLPAAVFDLACQACACGGRAKACFEISNDCLRIVFTPRSKNHTKPTTSFKISKRLPPATALARQDVAWMVQKLAQLAPLDLFDEMRKINQDLLQTLLKLVRRKKAPRLIEETDRKPLSA